MELRRIRFDGIPLEVVVKLGQVVFVNHGPTTAAREYRREEWGPPPWWTGLIYPRRLRWWLVRGWLRARPPEREVGQRITLATGDSLAVHLPVYLTEGDPPGE